MNHNLLSNALSAFFAEEQITAYAALPIEDCVWHEQKAKRVQLDFTPKSVLVMLLPYYVEAGENLSAYATSEDYHIYATDLGKRLSALLQNVCKESNHRFFCDSSPIDERDAAAKAGLGVLGDNRLLISPDYGSFVFICEVISDIPPADFGCFALEKIQGCLHCGACQKACVSGCLSDETRPCLSAVTQKKGELTKEEQALLQIGESVWGCDACQTVCPLNRKNGKIPQTPLPFFHENRITRITQDLLDGMSEQVLSRRAFAWRGKAPIQRNLILLENQDKNK